MAKRKDIMSTLDREQKKLLRELRNQVKELSQILQIVAGSQDVDAVRREHMQFLGTVGSRTLTPNELKLAKEGISLDELRKICGRKMLASEQNSSIRDGLSHGHVLKMVFAEHDIILYFLSDLETVNSHIQQSMDWNSCKRLTDKVLNIVKHLAGIDAHHVREERVIFPQLASHGYGEVPQCVFAEHVELRKARTELKLTADLTRKTDFLRWKRRLDAAVNKFVPMVREHIYKEENVIYPNALKVIQDPRKWNEMKSLCDDIGITCF
jgi:DUF438 domain-containing protein